MKTLLAILIVFVVLPFHIVDLHARNWHLNPDGTGDVATIQEGVDMAASGDTILLADGTYKGVGNRDIHILDKSLVIQGNVGNPKLCVIECEGSEIGGSFHVSGFASGVYFCCLEAGQEVEKQKLVLMT